MHHDQVTRPPSNQRPPYHVALALVAACRDRHIAKMLKGIIANMHCLTKLGEETGMTPYLGLAQYLHACFLRAQLESNQPPKESTLESAWSLQASKLQSDPEICSLELELVLRQTLGHGHEGHASGPSGPVTAPRKANYCCNEVTIGPI